MYVNSEKGHRGSVCIFEEREFSVEKGVMSIGLTEAYECMKNGVSEGKLLTK
jgi:hypothetical protein